MESLLGSSSWLYIIFIGLIVGVLARFLKPGRDGMGFFMTILLGIAGAAGASKGDGPDGRAACVAPCGGGFRRTPRCRRKPPDGARINAGNATPRP